MEQILWCHAWTLWQPSAPRNHEPFADRACGNAEHRYDRIFQSVIRACFRSQKARWAYSGKRWNGSILCGLSLGRNGNQPLKTALLLFEMWYGYLWQQCRWRLGSSRENMLVRKRNANWWTQYSVWNISSRCSPKYKFWCVNVAKFLAYSKLCHKRILQGLRTDSYRTGRKPHHNLYCHIW